MKKKFGNFLKQLGGSPKKKRNISANARGISEVTDRQERSDRAGGRFGYPELDDVCERSERAAANEGLPARVR
jgi:hypothetical protein